MAGQGMHSSWLIDIEYRRSSVLPMTFYHITYPLPPPHTLIWYYPFNYRGRELQLFAFEERSRLVPPQVSSPFSVLSQVPYLATWALVSIGPPLGPGVFLPASGGSASALWFSVSYLDTCPYRSRSVCVYYQGCDRRYGELRWGPPESPIYTLLVQRLLFNYLDVTSLVKQIIFFHHWLTALERQGYYLPSTYPITEANGSATKGAKPVSKNHKTGQAPGPLPQVQFRMELTESHLSPSTT